jgi:mono/diheme cytochrome c family protein
MFVPRGASIQVQNRLSVTRAALIALAVAALTVSVAARRATVQGDPEAAKIKNPAATSPESIAAGKKSYDTNCAGCHGPKAEGAEKAGIIISVIEDQGGKQPPDLTDDKWDHGSSDGEIFSVIKKGIGPQFFMAPWDGRMTDTEIWNVINYIRSLSQKK